MHLVVLLEKVELKEETDGQWKEFTITLDYGDKEFDSNQKYRFAIVCSSSKDGDKFWGAPGSKLWVDDIEVIYKK